MSSHLRGEQHGEIVAAVSRVVPIVVRRVEAERCPHPGCGRRFRLRFALRRHVRRRHGDEKFQPEGQVLQFLDSLIFYPSFVCKQFTCSVAFVEVTVGVIFVRRSFLKKN